MVIYLSHAIPWKDFNVDYPFTSIVTYNYDNSYIIAPQENESICYEIKIY